MGVASETEATFNNIGACGQVQASGIQMLVMSTPAAGRGRKLKRFLRGALVAGIVIGAAGAAVFGFIEGRQEQARRSRAGASGQTADQGFDRKRDADHQD